LVWLKLSDDFADDCARAGLSDAAFRTHVEGLLWCMRRETGGLLDSVAIRRAVETHAVDAAVAELVGAGFWSVWGDGWIVRHGMGDQPEPDLIARRRELTAERVRSHRRKRAGMDPVTPLHDALQPALRNALPGTGRVGSGGDVKEQTRLEEEVLGSTSIRAFDSWPEVSGLGSGSESVGDPVRSREVSGE
jgi:hypothetical protein